MPLIVGVAVFLTACATPGLIAMQQSDPARLQQILGQPNRGGENVNSLLSESVVYSNCLECVRLLLLAGAQPGTFRQGYKDGSGYFILEPGFDGLLAVAAWHGHAQLSQLFVDHGAEPTAAMSLIRGWGEGPGLPAAINLLNKLDQSHTGKSSAPASGAAETAAPLLPSTNEPPLHPAPAPWWTKSDAK